MRKSSDRPTTKSKSNDNFSTIATLVVAARRTDGSLADRHRAYTELVVRFQDMAFGCAFALLGDYPSAEDAAQEAFLSAYQRLGQLRDAAAFPGWLQQIVRTQCHRKLRSRSVAVVPLVEGPQLESLGCLAVDDGPEATALRRERRAQIAAALAALPETERLVTILFYVREYSRAEVAEFLGISVVAVKKRLASARGRLKERLVEMVIDDLHAQRPSNDAVFATRLMAFTKLFCSFVDEGRSLVRSLADLSAAEEDAAFRAAIDDINAEIQGGNCLSFAMAKHPTYFSPEYIAAIRNGEVVGRLEVVLARLADGTYSPDCVKALTAACDRAYQLAIEDARHRASGKLGWEHLLLGIVQQPTCRAAKTLISLGVDLAQLQAATVARIETRSSAPGFDGFEPAVVQLDARLDDEAARWGLERIDTVVLLVGLLEIGRTPEASGFFESNGITRERLRSAAADIAGADETCLKN